MPPAFALSQDQTLRFILLPVTGKQNELTLNSILGSPQSHEGQEEENHLENHCVCIAYAKYTHSIPKAANRASQDQSQPTPISHPHRSPHASQHTKNRWDAASVSLPFRFTSQRTKPGPTGPTPYSGTKPTQPSRRLATARPRACRPSRRRRFRRLVNPGQPPRACGGN